MPALSLESRKCAYRKNVTDGLKRVLFIVASPDMGRNDSKPVSMRAFLQTEKKKNSTFKSGRDLKHRVFLVERRLH